MNFLKKIIPTKNKTSININYDSPEFYAGMCSVYENKGNFIDVFFKYFQKNSQIKKQNNYFIKINMDSHYLTDNDFIDLTINFKIIVENFCDFFEIDVKDLELTILSATQGCFNINFGINICNNNFSLINLPNAKKKLMLPIIEYLTQKKIGEYENFISLFKDCISGYLAKRIDQNISQLKYIDIKKSNEAKKIIIKTLQKQPNLDSVSFNGEIVLASEMDVLL